MNGIATFFAKNAILGWLWRRAQEIASLAGIVVPLYMAMPPARRAEILTILSGQGGSLSISAAAGLAWYLFTQWQSLHATVKDQVVVNGQKVDTKKDLPAGKRVVVEEIAVTAAEHKRRQPNLLERMFGKSR